MALVPSSSHGGSGGSLPDPITTSVNIATADPDVGPLVITLPAGFDLGWYDAIEIDDSDGLRLLAFDVGGNLTIAANPDLGTPSTALTTDGSTARITLQQGSDAQDANLSLRPGSGRVGSLQVLNSDGTSGHTFTSGAAGVVGFYGQLPTAQQTAVAVTVGAIHAALVNLGLITA